MTEETEADDAGGETFDPRAMLAQWANSSDEWVRLLVAEVLATGRPVGASVIDSAYKLFRQEKALDSRDVPAVEMLSTEARQDETAPPLNLLKLSDVQGVNALVTGAEIEPHPGLTILYGENGTGKTGYSRIFKALADSRTADVILGNVDAEEKVAQSAKLNYTLGGDEHELHWNGERGVSPLTRMSIFDSPSVSTHVDEDLDYVYVPAALALFNHVIAAIQGVTAQIDAAISRLGSRSNGLLSRFQRGSSIYPLIETLGASTDLVALKAKASTDPDVDANIDALTQAVAALRSNVSIRSSRWAGRSRSSCVVGWGQRDEPVGDHHQIRDPGWSSSAVLRSGRWDVHGPGRRVVRVLGRCSGRQRNGRRSRWFRGWGRVWVGGRGPRR